MQMLTLFIKNQLSFFWLPSAWICGVRVDLEESNKCVVRVKLGFINKNPLKVVNMHIDNSTSAGFFWVAFNSHQELKDFLSYFKHKYEGQFL